uniref:protein TolQ n=1 Tax=Dongshaea marina TaxID=2047966 RepID=UPI002D77EE83|nr:protein TolQ [Dongshaea marina]
MSLLSLILEASWVVKLVMLLLVAMSIASWAAIFYRGRDLARARKETRSFEDKFWSGGDLNQLYRESLNHADDRHGLEQVFHSGFREYARLHQSGVKSPEMVMDGTYRAMRVTLSREVENLEASMSMLATIGSVSPYIGLFGTVWGIMHAFVALGGVEQASLNMVAPGIAEALIATAMGLFAAIPAVIAYNRFTHHVDRIEGSYTNFMDEFSTILYRQVSASDQQEEQS